MAASEALQQQLRRGQAIQHDAEKRLETAQAENRGQKEADR